MDYWKHLSIHNLNIPSIPCNWNIDIRNRLRRSNCVYLMILDTSQFQSLLITKCCVCIKSMLCKDRIEIMQKCIYTQVCIQYVKSNCIIVQYQDVVNHKVYQRMLISSFVLVRKYIILKCFYLNQFFLECNFEILLQKQI